MSIIITAAALFVWILSKLDVSTALLQVDDSLIYGTPYLVDPLIAHIDDRLSIRKVSNCPGNLRFFGLNIFQLEDMSITVDRDEKLNSIETMSISQSRHRGTTYYINNLEAKEFSSINSVIGWLGITA